MTDAVERPCFWCGKPTTNFFAYSTATAAVLGRDGVAVCDACEEQQFKVRMWQNEQDDTDELVCPWCGYVNRDSWELPDEDDAYECPSCGKTFEYMRQTTVTYSSRRLKRDYPGEGGEQEGGEQ